MKKKTKASTEETVETTANQFEYNGKKYNVLRGARVPLGNGSELLTPADICVHEEAKKYLVENGCSCVEEVIE